MKQTILDCKSSWVSPLGGNHDPMDILPRNEFRHMIPDASTVETHWEYSANGLDGVTGLRPNRALGFESGDANLYRYVRNAPTSYVDPFGLLRDYAAKKIMSYITDKIDVEAQLDAAAQSKAGRRARAQLTPHLISSKTITDAFIETEVGIIEDLFGMAKSGFDLVKILKEKAGESRKATLDEFLKLLKGDDIEVFSFTSGPIPEKNGKAFANLSIFYSNKSCQFVAMFEGKLGNLVSGQQPPFIKLTDQDHLEDFAFFFTGDADKKGEVSNFDGTFNWVVPK